MSKKPMTEEQFLRDVAEHKMQVLMDNGLYRHLKFRAPKNSWNQWFEIITWPGMLAINGDMGSWSFSRVDDMFTFFRSPKLRINESYWTEKIQSESRFGGPSKTFCAETFRADVVSRLDGHGLEDWRKAEIIEALDEEVFTEEYEPDLRRDLDDFKHEGFSFSDTWEISGKAYTYHYLWCLHAIVWGIQQYDAVHANEEAVAV